MTDWDERYAEPGFAYGTEPNAFLASVADRIPEGPVLCLADGEGRNGVFLAGRGHAVVSVDRSSVGLVKARTLAAERGVALTTIVADLADFTTEPGVWSGIVSIFAHVPSDLRRRLHRDVVAGLSPGGVLVLEAYRPEQVTRGTGGPSDPDRLMTLALLREELEGLDFEIAREFEREVIEGRCHTGTASVVQVLARKPTG